MSNKNTFDLIHDYFNEDEEEEIEEDEEFINYEKKSNNHWYEKLNSTKNKNSVNNNTNKVNNNLLNNKNENQIFTELYSNSKNNNDDVLYCEERNYFINKDNDAKDEQFKSFKVISFRPDNLNGENNDENNMNNENENNYLNNESQKENENENEGGNGNNNIIEKVETNNWLINSDNEENNGKQSKKEIIYNKIITGQCSFGNMNEVSNRSTSINTNNLIDNRQSSLFQENFEQEMLKPEYLINSNTFDQIENETNTSNDNYNNNYNNNIKSNFNENTYNYNINRKKYNIQENEKEWKNKKELIKKNINQLKNYMLQNERSKSKSKSKSKKNNNANNTYSNMSNLSNTSNKRPIELILYDDAIKKRQKMENIYKNNLTKIQLDALKSKINKKSYQIAIEHDDKKIESILNKYNNKKKGLEIIDVALIFQELKIFRKLLQNINVNKLSNISNIDEFKNRISIAINEGELRKIEELEFLEETWNMLNQEQKSGIKKEILEGLLKIIFSPVGNITDIANIVRQYLQVALFGDGVIQSDRNDRVQDNLKLKKYIKKFFKLKENIIAYKNIKNYNNGTYEKIINENNRNLTFEPNISPDRDYRTTITERRKNFNFDSLYNRFIEKEKTKQSNLNQLKKNKMRAELRELKEKPTITKYYDNYFERDQNQDIHEKLYKMDRTLREKRQKQIDIRNKEEKERIEEEVKSFKLNINYRKSRQRMAKSFDNKIKPKGFDEYVTRNKKAIFERNKLKTMIEKIPCGENYEKIRRRAITPFNITDMRNKYKKRNKSNSKDKDGFFSLQIKIPNGKMKTIKIYMDDDPYKVADEFCMIYSIKESVKQKLIRNIIKCQKAFINKRDKENNNNEEEES